MTVGEGESSQRSGFSSSDDSYGSLVDASFSQAGSDYTIELLVYDADLDQLRFRTDLSIATSTRNGLTLTLDGTNYATASSEVEAGSPDEYVWDSPGLSWSDGDTVAISLTYLETAASSTEPLEPTEPTEPAATSTDPQVPAEPAGLSANAGDGEVTLSWDDPGDSTITGYQYRLAQDGGGFGEWTDIASSGATSTSHTLTGLTNDSEYEFSVRAVNDVGEGAASGSVRATPTSPKPAQPTEPVATSTDAEVPAEPAGLSANAGDAQVTLSWDDSDDSTITGYQYRQAVDGGEFGQWAVIPGSGATTTLHTLTGLTDDVEYEFRVRAVNDVGEGAASGSVRATPTSPKAAQQTGPAAAEAEPPVPQMDIVANAVAPAGLSAAAGDTQVTLTWDNPNDSSITGYQVLHTVVTKLTAGGGAAGDRFGDSVGVDNNRAVVGAPLEESVDNQNTIITDGGLVHSFKRSSGEWSDEGSLLLSNPQANGRLGSSVAVAGSTAVIGAPSYGQINNPDPGRISIASWDSVIDSWATQFTKTGQYGNDFFGSSVALDTGIAVVGAPGAQVGTYAFAGKVYLNTKNNNVWGPSFTAIWSAGSNAAAGNVFGSSVAVDGSTVVIGSPGEDFYSGAVYVFTKTNNVWSLAARLTAPNRANNDGFGETVAIDGDTIVVGAKAWDGAGQDAGGAFVFTKPSNGWTNMNATAELTASDYANQDNFGGAVAVDGDTIVVGALQDDDNGTESGSVYLFTKPSGSWVDATETMKLTAPDGAAGDNFGESVAARGGTVIVGAPGDDRNSDSDIGAAYVFSMPEWTNITGSNRDTTSHTVIGLDNDVEYTFWVRPVDSGGPGPASGGKHVTLAASKAATPGGLTAAVGDRSVTLMWNDPNDSSITGYEYQQKVGAGQYGSWQAMSQSDSSTVEYTVTGLANGTTYTFRIKALDNHEDSDASGEVSVSTVPAAPTNLTAAPGDGEVDLSWDDPGNDTITGYEYSADGGANYAGIPDSNKDTTAYTVIGLTNGTTHTLAVRAVNGSGNGPADTVDALMVPAAPVGLSAMPGDKMAQLTWDDPQNSTITGYELLQLAEKARLTADDSALNDRFGVSVAVDGNTAVVGAFQPDYINDVTNLDVTGPGAAYVFTRDSDSGAWSQQVKLTDPDLAPGDEFGISVAVAGDTVAVGARGHDGETGAVYVFTKPANGWASTTATTTTLTASDGEEEDRFGTTVALYGDSTIVVGAPGDRNMVGGVMATTGSAYIFTKNADTGLWSQVAKLTASNRAAGDLFGNSVAVDEDTIAVGAYGYDGLDSGSISIADSGAVYVFAKAAADSWATSTETVLLTASDGAANDNFGRSVAVDGSTIVVGASGDQNTVDDVEVRTGSAYVFTEPSNGWVNSGGTETAKLTASDGAHTDQFGRSVAVDSDTILVGGHQNDDDGQDSGSFYIFEKPGDGWAEGAAAVKVTASDGKAGDRYGIALALDGDTAIVAAPRKDGNDDDNDLTNDIADSGAAYVLGISGWTDVTGSGATSTTHTLTDLTNYRTYTMAVRAVNETGDGPGAVVTVVPAPVPAAPANLQSEPGDTEVTLSWTNPGDVSIGVYEYSTDYTVNGASTFTEIPGSDKFTTGYTVTGLTNAVEYTLAVRALNDTGAGMPSAVTVTPAAVTAPPANLLATPGHRRATLTWDDPRDTTIQKYRLQWYQEPQQLAFDGVRADEFSGHSISMDGDTAVIGAPQNAADPGAVYVLTRDRFGPWSVQARLEATGGAEDNLFGWSVAVDGDTAVVGATQDEKEGEVTGAAYVFTRDSSGAWSQQARLTDDDLVAGDQVGYSVAVDGDTALVGAAQLTNSGSGAVYVFTREFGTWSRTAKLSASDGANGDEFGFSVALDGETIAIGAPRNDDNVVGEAGAAYVFTEDSDGDWVQVGKLTASDRVSADRFGQSVALDDNNILVGAPGDDDNGSDSGSAYQFTRPSDGWTDLTEQQKLTDPDGTAGDQFGYSVALDGDIAVVGAHGDNDVGADAGAALLFNRDGSGVWSEAAKLTASDGEEDDQFGYAMAVSGGSILIGAYAKDGSGSVYSSAAQGWTDIPGSGADTTSHTVHGLTNNVRHWFRVQAVNQRGPGGISQWAEATPDSFPRRPTGFVGVGDNLQVTLRWDDPENPTIDRHEYLQLLASRLAASDGAKEEYFGGAVAVDGDTAVVGAHLASGYYSLTGAAYVFTRDSSGAWSQVAQLTASDGWNADVFGSSVALDDEAGTIVVGAYGHEANREGEDPLQDTGAAYVFTRDSSGAWSQSARLTAADAEAYDQFGYSAAVYDDTVVVGTPGDGSAYVFVKPAAGWATTTETAKLSASDGGSDEFGTSIAADNGVVVVGANRADFRDSGAAYVFVKPTDGWADDAEPGRLVASDGANNDEFGWTVAVRGDTVVVGAPGDGPGSTYVFIKPATGWGAATTTAEIAKLTAPDGVAGDRFGWSVAVDDAKIVVGAYRDDDSGADSGSAYVFAKPAAAGDTDAEPVQIIAPDGASGDEFGWSVAADGNTVLVGARKDDDDRGSEVGSAYMYEFAWTAINDSGAGEENATSYAVTGLTDGVEYTYHLRAVNEFGDGPASGRVRATPEFVLPNPPTGLAADAEDAQITLSWDDPEDLTIAGYQLLQLAMDKPGISEGASGDQLGYSVAMDGDTAVVGAYLDDDSGSAYVFTRDSGGAWSRQGRLTASDGATDDRFGWSVAVDGDTIVIGSYGDDDKGSESGSAYMFVKSNSGWATTTETSKLTASDGQEDDHFGYSVAVNGNTVVVGAPGDGSATSSAYVFVAPSGGWVDGTNYTETSRLTASDGAPGDEFGIAVAVDDGPIVVGAHKDDDNGDDSGSAYLFVEPSGGWATSTPITETSKLAASDGAANDRFGIAVAVDNDTIVVGANRADGTDVDDSGAAYVFVEPDSGWMKDTNYTETARLAASDAAASDELGISVAVDGEFILIGAHRGDGTDIDGGVFADSGLVYVFTKPTLGWTDSTETATLIAPDAAAGDGFGYSVALAGNAAAIGAYGDDDVGSDSGSIYFVSAVEWVDMDGVDYTTTSHTVTGLTNYVEYTLQVRSVNASGHSRSPASVRAEPFPRPDQPTGFSAEAGPSRVVLSWDAVEPPPVQPPVDRYRLLHLALSELDAPEQGAGERFGFSVAVDGETALIGGHREDDDEQVLESAYIYTRDGSGLWSQKARLTASDGDWDDRFGYSVALDGATAVVGAYQNAHLGVESGAAYVFTRDRGTGVWSQSVKLTASDRAPDDYFGYSVAVDGETVVIGAYGDDDNGTDSGSVYVFIKPETGWADRTETAKLTASDGAAGDRFGDSVAVDDGTVAVGAVEDDDNGTESGSVYVFVEPITGWTDRNETVKLTPSDGAPGDRFGDSLAVDGNTLLVGSSPDDDNGDEPGSAYVFSKPDSGWNAASPITEPYKLTAQDGATDDRFGYAVALDGDIAVVGAYGDDDSGSVYVFRKDAESDAWPQTSKLTRLNGVAGDGFGHSLAVSGGTAVVGAYDESAGTPRSSAFVVNNGASSALGVMDWADIPGSASSTTSRVLTDLPSGVEHSFRLRAVNVKGDSPTSDVASATVLLKPDKPTGLTAEAADRELTLTWHDPGNSNISSYELAQTVPAHRLTPDDLAAGDGLGISVAVDGDTALIGAYHGSNDAGIDAGAVYVFTWDESLGVWSREAKLTSDDGASDDRFGYSVALDGDTAVVGAYRDDDYGDDSGAAYVFTRDPDTGSWSQRTKLTAADRATGPDGGMDDLFGVAVAVDGETVVVGAPFQDLPGQDDPDGTVFLAAGSAYVFTWDDVQGEWVQQAKLRAPRGRANDWFGFAVAVDGDTALISKHSSDDSFERDGRGRVFVFTRESGVWSREVELTASDGAPRDWFGYSVALDGDTAAVGARVLNNRRTGAGSGAAYVFTRDLESGAWRERAKLAASDGAAHDNFGFSVALDPETVAVGAWLDDDRGDDSGSVYVFRKPDTGWTDTFETDKLTAPDGAAFYRFGRAVAVEGNLAVVGASKADGADSDGNASADYGSAYILGIPEWNEIDGSGPNTSSTTVGALTNGVEYTFQVRALNSGGPGPASAGASATPLGVPRAPSDLATTSSDSQVTLSWSAPDATSTIGVIAKYQYRQKVGVANFGDWEDIPGSHATTTTYTVIGLANGVEYTFRVRAVNAIGAGPSSNEVSGTPEGDVSAKPEITDAIPGDTQVHLKWKDPRDSSIDKYEYLHEYTGLGDIAVSSGWVEVPKSDDRTISYEYTVTGLTNNLEYTFYIRAVDEQDLLTPRVASDGVEATPMGSPPFKPEDLKASGQHERVVLNWDDPSDASIDKYRYHVMVATSTLIDWTDIPNSNATTTTYTVTGLTNGVEYYFQIQVVDEDIATESETVSATPLPSLPNAPTLSVPTEGDTNVVLNWAAQSEDERPIDRFQVLRRFTPMGLIRPDGIPYDNYGYSVAMDGDTAVVGAYGDDDGGDGTGSVYVFTRDSSGGNALDTWRQTAKLTASDGEPYDSFGISVAIDGDTIVAGAYGDDDRGDDSGSAYVFTWSSIRGEWRQAAKLNASNGAQGDWFGYSVAVDDDDVLIGAPRADNVTGENSGSVYVFTKPATGWADTTQTAKLTASDGSDDDGLGIAVTLDDGQAMVGAYLDDDSGIDSGSVYVFIKPATGWATATETARLTAPDAAAGQLFGYSVAVDDDTVVVGAYGDDGNGPGSGSAYIFIMPATGWVADAEYNEAAKLTASDGTEGDRFGYSVAVNANTAVVGAYLADGTDSGGNPLTDSGSGYVFRRDSHSDEWVQTARLTVPEGAAQPDDWFGHSVAVYGDFAVIGAHGDDSNGSDSGTAYFMDLRDWMELRGSTATTTSHTIEGLTNGIEYEFQVRGLNVAGGGQQSDEKLATPSGTNVNPAFDGAVSRDVIENTPVGGLVGAPVTATSTDDDPLFYTLSGVDASSFRIATSTGQIMVSPGAVLDYESGMTTYSVVAMVRDNKDLTDVTDSRNDDSVVVTINVTNADDPGSVELSSISPIAGGTLTAGLTDADGGVRDEIWRWQRGIDQYRDGVWQREWSLISGATSIAYTAAQGDVGRLLRALVTYDDYFSTGRSATSSATAAVVAAQPQTVEITFQGGTYTAVEGGEPVTVMITLTNAAPTGGLVIPITVTADSAADYTVDGLSDGEFTIAIEEGSDWTDFEVTANGDEDTEDETLTFGFGELPSGMETGEHPTATVILDDTGAYLFNDEDRTPEDTPVTIPVLVNDIGVTRSDIRLGEPASNGKVTVNDDGSFTYTPNRNFNGEDTFTYAVNGVESATVVVRVDPVNDEPQAVGVIPSQRIETGDPAREIGISNRFQDVDGDTLTYTVASDSDAVSVSWRNPVVIVPGSVGNATVTITATDPGGLSAIHLVSVTVVKETEEPRDSEVDDPVSSNSSPVFTEGHTTTRFVPEDAPIGTAAGEPVIATDRDLDPLEYSLLGKDRASFEVDPSTAQITTRNLLNYETQNAYSVLVRVDDGRGAFDLITVDIDVMDVDEPPSQPAAPLVSGAGSTRLTVSWPAPANQGPQISDYDVRYREAEGDFRDAGHDGAGTSLALSGLRPETVYEVQVRASNAEGTSAWSESGRGQTQQTPPAPTPGPTAPPPSDRTPTSSTEGTPTSGLEATPTPSPAVAPTSTPEPTAAPMPEATVRPTLTPTPAPPVTSGAVGTRVPATPSASVATVTAGPQASSSLTPQPLTTPAAVSAFTGAAAATPTVGPAPSGDVPGDGGFPWWISLIALALLAAIVLGVWVRSNRNEAAVRGDSA